MYICNKQQIDFLVGFYPERPTPHKTTGLMTFFILIGCLSESSVSKTNHTEIFLKCRVRFSKSGARPGICISYKLPPTVVPGTHLKWGDRACSAEYEWCEGPWWGAVIMTASCGRNWALNTEFLRGNDCRDYLREMDP